MSAEEMIEDFWFTSLDALQQSEDSESTEEGLIDNIMSEINLYAFNTKRMIWGDTRTIREIIKRHLLQQSLQEATEQPKEPLDFFDEFIWETKAIRQEENQPQEIPKARMRHWSLVRISCQCWNQLDIKWKKWNKRKMDMRWPLIFTCAECGKSFDIYKQGMDAIEQQSELILPPNFR